MYIPLILLEIATIVFFLVIMHNSEAKSKLKYNHEWDVRDLERKLSKQQEETKKLQEEFEEIEHERFVIVIKNEISRVQLEGHYTKYTEDELCAMILENGEKIGVTAIEDISFFFFEDTIKAALYASKGYFDVHTSPSGARYRIGKNGKHIPVTDEEIEMLENYDFDFIYDSLA